MSPTYIALLSLVSVLGGAALGMFVRWVLPQDHLSADTKDAVKLAMALVATMTALVLGLLIASAKGSYDAQRNQLIQMAAKFAFLDRVLANCGPDAPQARTQLRMSVEQMIARIWPDNKSKQAELAPITSAGQAIYQAIQKLSPQTDAQRAAKSQALQTTVELGQMYWLLFEQAGTAISKPLLIVVVFWLAVLFLSFAAQRHRDYGAHGVGGVRVRRDLPAPRTGPAVRRIDRDLQRADAPCAGTFRALGRNETDCIIFRLPCFSLTSASASCSRSGRMKGGCTT